MGTFFEIKIPQHALIECGLTKSKTTELFKQIEDSVLKLHQIGNIYDANSPLSKLNRNATLNPIVVDQTLFKLINSARNASIETKGVFDATVKPIMDYFHKDISIESLSPTVKARLLKRVGYENMILNYKAKTVYLKNNAQVDLSGLLKGKAVKQILDILRKNQITSALINGGGTIYGLGQPQKDRFWKIGIKNPAKPNQILRSITLYNQAVATSGGYERNIENKYSHIVNPKTKMLIPAKGSVTVIAKSAYWADVYSTALFIDPKLKTPYYIDDVFIDK